MKRSLLVLVSLLLIVAMFLTTAAATPPSVKFVSSHFTPGKGVVFIFEVKGLDHQALKGWVTFSGKQFNLDCNEGDGNNVICVAGNGVSQFAGKSVKGTLGGFGFSAQVPAKREPKGQDCYSIYDYWSFTGWDYADMVNYGASPICQDAPASPGDQAYYEFQYSGNGLWYGGDVYYGEDGTDACAPNMGPGYYYVDC